MLPTSYTMSLYAFTIIACVVFIILFKIQAPYGRHSRPGWGPAVHVRMAWIIMESPAAILPPLLCCIHANGVYTASLVLLCIWEIHYIHRTFIYPFMIKGNRPMPLSIMLSGFVFNCCNGLFQGMWLFHYGRYTSSWFYSPAFLAGIGIFFCGLFINIHSDHITRTLRKPGENGYRIPYGGLYRFVSAPNYLGEIIEWTGWAVMTWSVPGLVFAIWTIGNLAPRAYSNHKWYKNTFPDYPADRKALVPHIW